MKRIYYGLMFLTLLVHVTWQVCRVFIKFVYPSLCITLETLHVPLELSHHIRNDEGLTGENYVVLHARKCQFDAIYNLV